MSKPAWMPLYVQRFYSSADVMMMSHEAVGAYALLLCVAWHAEPPGTLPDDDKALAVLCRMRPAQWLRVKAEVMRAFELTDGRWHQVVMVGIASKSYAKLEQSREAAKASVASRSVNARSSGRSNDRSSGRSPRPVVVLTSEEIQDHEHENNNTAGSTPVATPARMPVDQPLTFEPDDGPRMDPRLEILTGVGIAFGVAQKLIRDHDTPADLLSEYVDMSLESSVKNRAAFVRAAIAGSYAPRRTNVARVSPEDIKAAADAEKGTADGLARAAAKLKARAK